MKTRYNKLMLAAVFTVISAANLVAQPTALPYKNGFEGATTDWAFVSDAHNPANSWTVGTAVKRSGNQSLYVSDNNGTTANYDDTAASTIFAYREFTLTDFHSYSIYFDWRSKGALGDSLYVCWVENSAELIAAGANGSLPAWVNSTKKLVLGGQETAWQNASFSVCGTGQPAKLVFVWTNNGDNVGPSASPSAAKSPAGNIDNLQINQNLDLTYKNGFDLPEQTAEWTLYNNASFPNKWTFGSAAYLTPGGALYISNNGGAANTYTDTKGFSSAVKAVTLPAGEQYSIDFDWMAGGDAGDYIWVGWADSTFTNFTRLGNDPPATFPAIAKLNNSLVWKHHTATVTGTGRPFNLVFMWVNNANINRQPAGVVDNIVISKTGVCPPPTNISTVINGRDITVSWVGSSSTYRLSYRNTNIDGSQYITVDNATSPYVINNAERGVYSFMVSGICNNIGYCGAGGNLEYKNDTTAWTAKHGVLVVVNDGCIDYTNLTNSAIVQGQSGTWGGYGGGDVITGGLVDNGYASDLSRHTIHYVPEYDTLTNGGLRTIPDGALASVRLGNKRNINEWESVTYTITVDSAYSLLIMQYAIVLENPNHGATEQPKFTLTILNPVTNQPIDSYCGDATFIAGASLNNDPTWHTIPGNTFRVPSSNTGTNMRWADIIQWKEWTTVGLNLNPYRGQTIKVRLTTYDCSASGHFGYAYFTLGCAKAALSGLSCGENQVTSIDAPEGFVYCWYKRFNENGTPAVYNPNNCVSTERGFTPASNDTATYICRAIFVAEPICFIELTARLAPRSPVAQGSFNHIPSNCENFVQLRNQSYVAYGQTLSTEAPETQYWLVTQGSNTILTSTQTNPIISVPNAGGTYNVRLIAGLMNDQCTDTATFTMVVPEIKDTRDTVTACVGQIPEYPNEGVFSDTLANRAGCDSILTFIIQNEIKIDIDRTICYGDSVLFEGVYYKATGDYPKTFQTAYGCDSVRELHLQVNPVMDILMKGVSEMICADDPSFMVAYENRGGSEATKYILDFNAKAENAGFVDTAIVADGTHNIVVELPNNLRPDKYSVDISFVDEVYQCEGATKSLQFDVNYPSYIIEQRWGDVIALLNPRTIVQEPRTGHTSNADDYTFSAYQWYKNSNPIEEENGTNLYIEGGLDLTAQYQLLVTRVIDGIPLFTCAIQPHAYSDQNNVIMVLGEDGLYHIAARNQTGIIKIYSVTGILISAQKFSTDNTILNVPTQSGVYILNILFDNGNVYKDKIIVR